jgi:signal transduction histidine kinase
LVPFTAGANDGALLSLDEVLPMTKRKGGGLLPHLSRGHDPLKAYIGIHGVDQATLAGIPHAPTAVRARPVTVRAWHPLTRQTDPYEHAEMLRARLADAEETLRRILHGEIDPVAVEGTGGIRAYTRRNADEPYRNLVEQMEQGAVVLTASGRILFSNARFASLVGEPLRSVVGSHLDRFVGASDRDDLTALLGAGSGRRRCIFVSADSGPFEVNLSLTTTRSTGGDRLNLIVTDLRELLEANKGRDHAETDNRTKDAFLALLAHELRNPLSAICNAVHVLELTHAEGDRALHAHDVIARQVGHISHLIDDLLDVERVVSGKIRLHRQPLDLADAVRHALATFTDDARLDRIVDITTEPVWVDGDAMRIEQVLTNIVTNAVKYTPPGGGIRVLLRADGDDAVLCVADTGFGISPRLLPYIFDLYVQDDRTLDRAQGGLGIGLTLVRQLVELHGGTILASSDGEGHGSQFTVRMRRLAVVGESPRLLFPSPRPADTRCVRR